jgi:drug/metabolite transporter (DMT)-like permease
MWKQFAFLNAIFYATASLALRKYEIVDRKITSFQIFFSIITIGFLFTLFVTASFKKYRTQVSDLYNSLMVAKTKPKFAFWIILVSILYILGDMTFFTSHITTPHITLLLLIGTLVGASIEITGSYLFFNEKLKARSVVGIVLMLSGAYLL